MNSDGAAVEPTSKHVVVDGKYIAAAGVPSSIDVALDLVGVARRHPIPEPGGISRRSVGAMREPQRIESGT